ncbi:MAG: cyclic nucleotide-binding domain-containing protein [Treponema sp.]|nr:cyclic nucleotide-binding domain-containing protein [Treponema sp.]
MENQIQLGFVKYVKDAYIVVEGKQDADCFYIIQQGIVSISKIIEFETEGEEILGPGDFFGVISTMSGHNHIETARALSDVVLIKVLRNQYAGLIQKTAPVAIKIIKQFSQRLRFLNQTLANLTTHGMAEESPSHLFHVGEYYYSQRQGDLAVHAYVRYIRYCPEGDHIAKAKERLASLASRAAKLKMTFDPSETSRSYRKDTMIFAESEPGFELFIIQKGSVKITKIVDNKEVLLAVLNPGDIFGEMALLEGKGRAASAVAYEDCSLMVVNKANFELMITNQPQLIERVTTLLAERIWLIYKQLANTNILSPLGRMYDALRIQLEKNRLSLYDDVPYTFSFGPDELYNMAGVPKNQRTSLLAGMVSASRIQVINDRIHTNSVLEIGKLAEYYLKMDAREKTKKSRTALPQ